MPGSSLWLLPPPDHPLSAILSSLIRETSEHFHSPHLFIPHVTLTSEIDPFTAYKESPQQWLDTLPFPPGTDVRVKLGDIQSEDVFVRKLYLTVEHKGISGAATVARSTVEGCKEQGEAAKWVAEKFRPHLSLLYHDCPQVKSNDVAHIEKLVKDAGVRLNEEHELGGWSGGKVVLVPTDRPIKEWAPIAEREL